MMNVAQKRIGSFIVICLMVVLTIYSMLVQTKASLEPVSTVAPLYPKAALKDGLEGHVKLGLRINDNGDVTKAIVVNSTNDIFNQNALEAVKQWRFSKNNAASFNYKINFKLGK